jgi:hypothetical protein
MDPLDNRLRIVNIAGRAELLGEIRDALTGNLRPQNGKRAGRRHGHSKWQEQSEVNSG